MNYQKIYDDLISKAKSENRKKYKGVYYEKHHIIPRCLRGKDDNNKKVATGEFKDFDEECGYDMSLERCIDKIVKFELLENQETVDLRTFLTEYDKAKQELLTAIKK